MKTEGKDWVSKLARKVCPNWMHPTGDAHYRDVQQALLEAWRQGMTDAALIAENTPEHLAIWTHTQILAARDNKSL